MQKLEEVSNKVFSAQIIVNVILFEKLGKILE